LKRQHRVQKNQAKKMVRAGLLPQDYQLENPAEEAQDSLYGAPSSLRSGGGGSGVVLTVLGLLCLLLAGGLLFMLAGRLMTLQGAPPAGNDASSGAPPDEGNTALALAAPAPPFTYSERETLDETLFIGDSNFVRLGVYGLVDPGRVLAELGIGINRAARDAVVTLPNSSQARTMIQAAKALNPRRILVMLGTNDIGSQNAESFAVSYEAFLVALWAACPNSHIAAAGIPPIAPETSYADFNAGQIGPFNEAILKVCQKLGVLYLDTHAALNGENGYCQSSYTDTDGLHLNEAALREILQYYTVTVRGE
jgi:lysophospholipase L1-like esterase